jgi:hypothetical protein
MALSLFKTKEPESTVGPALTALHAHLDVDTGIVKQVATLTARMRSVDDDERRVNDLLARKQALQTAMDTAMADARYSEQPAPDQSADHRKLTDFDNQIRALSSIARAGSIARTKLQADINVLLKKRADLKPQTDRLLWEAAKEEAVAHLSEYQAASERLRAVAHRVFAAFCAADTISRARGFGEFYGSGLYSDLRIPMPNHPAYQPNALGPEAALRAQSEDAALVVRKAEDLINRLLNGS